MIASNIPSQVISRSRRNEQDQLALFIDFENVAKLGGKTICDLYHRLEQDDTITLARAYGDWGRFAKAKLCLASCGVRLIEMPAGLAGKNSADMQLAVDAMEAALLYPSLNTFVFVSGDRDFVPLARVLRRWGKQVWAYAPSDGASSFLKAACDRFEIMQPRQAVVVTAASQETAPPRLPEIAPHETNRSTNLPVHIPEQIVGLVAWAHYASQCSCTSVERREQTDTNRPVAMTNLFTMMRAFCPGFSPKDFVDSSNRTNILFAEQLQALGVIRITRNEKGTQMLVPTAKCEQLRASFPPPENLESSIAAAREIRRFRYSGKFADQAFATDAETIAVNTKDSSPQETTATFNTPEASVAETATVALDRVQSAVSAVRSFQQRFRPR